MKFNQRIGNRIVKDLLGQGWDGKSGSGPEPAPKVTRAKVEAVVAGERLAEGEELLWQHIEQALVDADVDGFAGPPT